MLFSSSTLRPARQASTASVAFAICSASAGIARSSWRRKPWWSWPGAGVGGMGSDIESRSGEGGHGCLGVSEDFKQVEQTHHAQRLHGKLGGIYQLNIATALASGGQRLHEYPYAAG